MSGSRYFQNFQLSNLTAQATTVQSGSTNIETIRGYSVHAVYTVTTASFTMTLQASNDGINWATIPNTSVAISASGQTLYDLSNQNYKFFRIDLTRTSGTLDTFTAQVNLKDT